VKDLSIIIPARNEQFLKNTVDDILKSMRGNTEVIVILDGEWSDPPLDRHDRVSVIYHPKSIGQRAAQNEGVRMSNAKYVMKVDAHCAFDEGFDVKMLKGFEEAGKHVTMVPVMKNLHVYDWICQKCGKRWYMGPDPKECENEECDGKKFKKEIVWKPKPSPNSTSYLFNTRMQFWYFGGYKKKQAEYGKKHNTRLVETMSLQGSCFMVARDEYWEYELCDESWGSWGQQGTEVACKTWLSGGRVLCNLDTWYAHMFRTRKGFRWPYPAPGKSQMKARQISRDIFYHNKWPKQKHPLSWLVDKFKPVPGWHDDEGKEILGKVNRAGDKFYKKKGKGKPGKSLSKGIVFYTDNKLTLKIAHKVQGNLRKIGRDKGISIISCSLKRMSFGDKNIHFPNLKRGYVAMFKQMLGGIENSTADIIFLAEHDVLYHPSHLDFVPPKRDVFYYNTNVYRVRSSDGLAVRTDDCRQVSGLCAYRELLLDHYTKRLKMVEEKLKELGEGKEFNRFIRQLGFEPGTHGRIKEFAHLKSERWESKHPNIDIRHGGALTRSKWKPEDYRNKRFAKGWKEIKQGEEISGWGMARDILG
jgi:glycosyltransferase involved in cell wall biosynthesis